MQTETSKHSLRSSERGKKTDLPQPENHHQHHSQMQGVPQNVQVVNFQISAKLRRLGLVFAGNETFRYYHMDSDKLGGRSGLRIAQNGPEHVKQHFLRFRENFVKI